MEWKYFQFWNTNFLLQILLITALWHTTEPCLDKEERKSLLNPAGYGSEIVEAVILKLHSLQILTCHHRLLRRIALVETEDGTSKPGGGIWALDVSRYSNITQEVKKAVNTKLCLNVTGDIPYNFLKQPLISGLASNLYLNYLENNRSIGIPVARDIKKQAQFWNTYYHLRNLSVNYFVAQVTSFEGKCDLVFFEIKSIL